MLKLKKGKQFEKLISYTTDATVGLQGGEWYHYISVEAFREMSEKGEMFESTMYAGHSYGSRKADVEQILAPKWDEETGESYETGGDDGAFFRRSRLGLA